MKNRRSYNGYRPVLYQVLIEMEEVEETSESGIILATKTDLKIQQGGHGIGTVRAFGPTVFQGYEGCDGPDDAGVKLDDKVEFTRYEGQPLLLNNNMRMIPDIGMIAVIDDSGDEEIYDVE